MKCAACGASLSAWHRFCADCGEPRPRWPEPFENCLAQFQSLTSRWEQGQLSDPEYESGLRNLAFPYKDSYWTIGAQSGNWYRHDGQGWLKDDPLQVAALSNNLPSDGTLAAAQPDVTGPTASEPVVATEPAVESPTTEPLVAEPSPAEPFTLDEEDEPARQEPATAPVSPHPSNAPGPRPTVRLNMPEAAATVPVSAAAPVSTIAVTPAVAKPPRAANVTPPMQAQEQRQQETGLGCVRPALTGFIAALVLLCVLIVLAAWLEPSLLRPLTRLLWPGG